MLSFVGLIVCAALIYGACEYFVNGVEWLGRRMQLTATMTGAILAAIGTALPESAVTFVAVVFGHDAATRDVGVGAALGGPLVLATIAYPVVGLVLLLNRKQLHRRTSTVQVDDQALSRDQAWFLCIFIVKIALGIAVFRWKPLLGSLFLVAYGLYVWHHMRASPHEQHAEETLEPLKLRSKQLTPHVGWAWLQTILALIIIGSASSVFVAQLEAVGALLNLSPHLVALLLSPVATELPETMNAVIWVRQGKERLALANISGAMMIQATVPSALGLFFTPWHFDRPLLASGVCTLLAVMWLWWAFRRGPVSGKALLPAFLFYAAFGALLVGVKAS